MLNLVKMIVFYVYGFDIICVKNIIYMILCIILDFMYIIVNFKLVFFIIICICYNIFIILYFVLKVIKIVY